MKCTGNEMHENAMERYENVMKMPCFKHLGCFFLGRLSRWLTRANLAIPSRDSAKKLRNDPLRESHFLNVRFLNSRGGGV